MTDHIIRALRAYGRYDNMGQIFFRTETDDTILLLVNCGDIFSWACADAQEITPDNIDIFEQSLADTQAAYGNGHPWDVPTDEALILFCARVRKMRPQGCVYGEISKLMHPLLDAAGPERSPSEPGNTPRK
jgi:hypothetical protein